MTMAHALVFDSGVGGLSVLQEMRGLPGFKSFTYAADNGFFPYGEKPDETLVKRVDEVTRKLVACFQPDVLVIACNTASTIALAQVRQHASIPVVGVVPSIKPAAELTKTGVIGLLATEATINRPYTDQLIEQFAPGRRVIRIGSQKLVRFAEAKLMGEPPDPALIRSILEPFRAEPLLDVVVLGCTHFPFLREECAIALGRKVTWLDSGVAVAKQAVRVLEARGFDMTRGHKAPSLSAVFTAQDAHAQALQPALSRMGFTSFSFR